MILYGSYTSPYVRHCRIELAQAGLEYKFVETDYAASDSGSPTKRVPFLADGDVTLTDSSSILLHLRNRQNKPFIQDAQEMDIFCMANTALDTAINLFLLEREGQTPDNNAYLARQSKRVESALKALEGADLESLPALNLVETRIGCFLAWGLFRNRFEIDDHVKLQNLLARCNEWPLFADTAPPTS